MIISHVTSTFLNSKLTLLGTSPSTLFTCQNTISSMVLCRVYDVVYEDVIKLTEDQDQRVGDKVRECFWATEKKAEEGNEEGGKDKGHCER